MVTKRIEIRKIAAGGAAGSDQVRKVVVVKKKGDGRDIRWIETLGDQVEVECVCGEDCSCASGVCSCGCCELEFVGSTDPEVTETEGDGEQIIRIRIPRVGSKDGGSDPLVRAAGVTGAIDDLEGQVTALVQSAREQGYSWTRIGQALGISKQAAWERFSDED
jgi:hypothetical protein